MDPTGESAGQFLGLNLKFDCNDGRGRQVKGILLTILLAAVYHPCHNALHEAFINNLHLILACVPPNAHLIIGNNVNAKLG
jgi:hypothetical protein